MADLSPEAGLRAVLEKPLAPGAPITPAHAEAQAIRDKAAVKGPDAALGSLQELKNRTGAKDPKQAIDEAILSTGPGGYRQPAEQARYDKAFKIADQIEKGYTALSATEQGEIETAVGNILNSSPDIAAFVDTLPIPPGLTRADVVKQVVKNLLTRPEFATFLKRSLYTSTEQSKMPPEISRDVMEACQRAENVVQNKYQRKVDVVAELGRVDNKLAADWGAGTPNGIRLAALSTEKTTIDQRIEDANDEKSRASSEITNQRALRRQAVLLNNTQGVADADQEIANLGVTIATADGNLAVAQNELRQFNRTGKLTELNRLQQEKDELTTRKGNLQNRRDALDDEILAAEQDAALPKLALGQAMSQRAIQEAAFVAGVEGVFGQATIEYLTAELGKAEKARTDLNEEAKAAVATNKDAEAKAIGTKALNEINKNWDTDRTVTKWFGRKVVRETNKTLVTEDMNALLAGGPEDLVRKYLIRMDRSLGPPATSDRLDALMANKELVDQLQPQLLEAVLAKRLDGSMGKISEDDAKRIASSPWGQELIDKAIARNENIRKQIEDARAKGVVSGDFLTWVAKQPGGSLAWLIALLFGSVVGVVGTAMLGGAIPAIGLAASEAAVTGAGMAGKGAWNKLKAA